MQAQEQYLQSRLLRAQNAIPRSVSPSNGISEKVTALEEEIASLQISHTTVTTHVRTIAAELEATRSEAERLREENRGWELLLHDQTISGQLRGGSGLLARKSTNGDHVDDEDHKKTKGSSLESLKSLDEDDEAPEIVDQNPTFDFEHDLDDFEEGSASNNGNAPSSRSRKGKIKGDCLGDIPVTGSGLDLAAELGRAETTLDGDQMRVLGKGDEGEGLHHQVL